MRISDVVVFRVSGQRAGTGSASEDRRVQAGYVEIQTDEGVSGHFGPIDDGQAFVILRYLRPFLIGKDPLATEFLLDQMLRLNRHGRSGLFMTGVSPVDCALWDLKGKHWGEPVWRLLGGPTRPAVPAYASMLGFSVEPQEAAQTAREYKEKGFRAQKWFFRHKTADGQEGMARNLAMARAVREAVGPRYDLMFDIVMGWDLPYSVEIVKELAALKPRWLEEPIPPERVGQFCRIRRAAGVPIATGEHVYTRWQVKELLEREAVDVIQTDPDWCGGITELAKICAVCSAFGIPVVAHGHSLLAALHVAGAQPPDIVPYVEFLIIHQENKQFFHDPVYRPENGEVKLPEIPGLGIVLDESKIQTRETLSFK